MLLSEEKPLSDQKRGDLKKSIERYFQSALADGSYFCAVAADEDTLVAAAGISFFSKPPSLTTTSGIVGYLSNVYTLPAYRKQGIAGNLIELIHREASSRGCTRISLRATESGKPLYRRFGFVDSHDDMILYIK